MYDSKNYYITNILNENQIIISGGINFNINDNDEFQVLSTTVTEIKNPKTGEILDKIPIPKCHLKVAFVEEKYTVLETFDKVSSIDLLNFNSLNKFKTEKQKLNIDTSLADDIFNKFSDEPIKIGDIVKRIDY